MTYITYLPYMEVVVAVFLLHIAVLFTTRTAFFTIVYKLLPVVFALLLLFDAGHRLGFVINI